MTSKEQQDAEARYNRAIRDQLEAMEQVERCCEDMMCEQCGLELDAHTDCDCMCHTLV